MTMVKLGRFALLALLVATVPACSKDATDEGGSSGGGSSSLKGTWDLVSANGDPVPSIVDDDGECKFIIKSASFTFRSDGTYSSTASLSEACTGEPAINDTETDSGTWSSSSGVLTLTDSDGFDTEFAYTLSGSTLTFSDDGDGTRLVFKRR